MSILRFLSLLSVACFLLGLVNCRPANVERVDARQDSGLNLPTTLTTTQTTQTMMGPISQTCNITLTLITDADGSPAIQEVKSCTLTTPGSSRDSQPPSGTSSSTTSSSATSSSTSYTTTSYPDAASAPTAVPSPPTDSNSTSPASPLASSSNSSSTASTSPTQTNPTPVTTLGIPASDATPSSPAPTSPAVPSPAAGDKVAATPVSTVPIDASAAPDSTATTSSDTSFTLPGKNLSVLPIGLGVFAGISVIALVIVGLVRYERTKYRKAFRQRKLAEAGSAAPYDGMT